MWRHIFLDFGGTLASERAARHEIYAEEARGLGWPVEVERLRAAMEGVHARLPRRIGDAWRYDRAWFGIYMEQVFCVELALPRSAIKPLAERLFARFADPRTFRLHEGALELLERLREAGLSLTIVSNWSYALPDLLAALGVGQRVDAIVTSALVGCEKPEAAIFELALGRAQAERTSTLHAGDRLDLDCQGAAACGITPVWLRRSSAPARGMAPPNLRQVGSLFELGQLILDGRT